MANQRNALRMEEIAQSTQIQLVLIIKSHITQESNKGSSFLTKWKNQKNIKEKGEKELDGWRGGG